MAKNTVSKVSKLDLKVSENFIFLFNSYLRANVDTLQKLFYENHKFNLT